MAIELPKDDSPSTSKTAFICPHCGTKTTQYWFKVFADPIEGTPDVVQIKEYSEFAETLRIKDAPVRIDELGSTQYVEAKLHNAFLNKCMECGKFVLWFGNRMLFPSASKAPPPSPDMPEEVRADYEEAGRILSLSPRGAAALLRLSVEKLCHHLEYKQKTIDACIRKMVEDGLPHQVERALDVVRVVGNGAVHPGHLDLKDDLETATQLFGIVNYIVMDRITRPNELAKLFETKVTDGQKAEIAKRRPKPRDSEG